MKTFLRITLLICLFFFAIQNGRAQTPKRYVCGTTNYGFQVKDMSNCQTVLFDSISGLGGVDGGSAFDHVHNHYLQASQDASRNNIIEVFDANTGKLLPNISLTGRYMSEIEYDDSNNTLYGFGFNGVFVSLNLSTNVYDTITTFPAKTAIAQGNSTFDPVNGRFFDVFDYDSAKSALGIVDIHTGKITFTDAKFSVPEYCKANGKVYGLQQSTHGGFSFISYDISRDKITVLDTNLDWAVMMGSGTFDDVNNLFVFEGQYAASPPNTIVMIDTTGKVTTCTSPNLFDPEAFSSGSIKYTAPVTYDTLKGRVTTSTGTALKNTYIYKLLYNVSDSTLYANDSTKTDTTGHYQFLTNDSAVYLYASPDSADYPNELGTYYDSSLTIQLAAMKALHTGTTIVNFNTLSGTNHSGGGFIGGKITICNCKKPGKGQPVPNLRVVLIDSLGNAVKQTYTNASGSFGFNNVGYGKYKIWVDYPKVDNSIAPQISISATAPNRTDNYSLYPTYLQIYTTTSILAANPETGGLNIYPNPFTQSTNIEYTLTANATITLKVYDITGREVANLADEIQTAGKYYFILDANKYSLPAGMYMIKLTVNGATNNQEIIKIK